MDGSAMRALARQRTRAWGAGGSLLARALRGKGLADAKKT
eukprot:COSAG06_NODE_13683_length_1232_cov_0.686673_2_plen_39_part_01